MQIQRWHVTNSGSAQLEEGSAQLEAIMMTIESIRECLPLSTSYCPHSLMLPLQRRTALFALSHAAAAAPQCPGRLLQPQVVGPALPHRFQRRRPTHPVYGSRDQTAEDTLSSHLLQGISSCRFTSIDLGKPVWKQMQQPSVWQAPPRCVDPIFLVDFFGSRRILKLFVKKLLFNP